MSDRSLDYAAALSGARHASDPYTFGNHAAHALERGASPDEVQGVMSSRTMRGVRLRNPNSRRWDDDI